jgi:hypothetical protein
MRTGGRSLQSEAKLRQHVATVRAAGDSLNADVAVV